MPGNRSPVLAEDRPTHRTTSVRIPADDFAWLQDFAWRTRQRPSAVLRAALTDFRSRREGSPDADEARR